MHNKTKYEIGEVQFELGNFLNAFKVFKLITEDNLASQEQNPMLII